MRQSANILMQGVPDGLDLEAVRKALVEFPGVVEVHDLHAWALGSKEAVLTVHVVGDDSKTTGEKLRGALAGMLEERFGIEHATLQVEAVPCGGHGVHA